MAAMPACSPGVNSAIVVDVLPSTRCVRSDSAVDDNFKSLYSRHIDISKIAPFSTAFRNVDADDATVLIVQGGALDGVTIEWLTLSSFSIQLAIEMVADSAFNGLVQEIIEWLTLSSFSTTAIKPHPRAFSCLDDVLVAINLQTQTKVAIGMIADSAFNGLVQVVIEWLTLVTP